LSGLTRVPGQAMMFGLTPRGMPPGGGRASVTAT